MTPFLFLIMAEGLNGLIRSTVDNGIFKEYVISGRDQKVGVSHIQYADDTILVAEMSKPNVLAAKCILRVFEVMAELKVNFHKSGLIGIKPPPGFLECAASILNYKIGKLPVKFLGVLVGSNPRRLFTWSPFVNSIQKKASRVEKQIFILWW